MKILVFLLGLVVGALWSWQSLLTNDRKKSEFTSDRVGRLAEILLVEKDDILAAAKIGNNDLRLQAYDKMHSGAVAFIATANPYGKWSVTEEQSPLTDAQIVKAVLKSDSMARLRDEDSSSSWSDVTSGTLFFEKNGDNISLRLTSRILRNEVKEMNQARGGTRIVNFRLIREPERPYVPLDLIIRVDAKTPVNVTLTDSNSDFVLSETDQAWLLKELRVAKTLLLYRKTKSYNPKTEEGAIQIFFSPNGIGKLIDK